MPHLAKRIIDRVKELKEQVEDHKSIILKMDMSKFGDFVNKMVEEKFIIEKQTVINEYTKLLNDEV